jgi:hypothetical protein
VAWVNVQHEAVVQPTIDCTTTNLSFRKENQEGKQLHRPHGPATEQAKLASAPTTATARRKSIHLEVGAQGEEVGLEAGERADGSAPHRGTLSPPRPPQEERRLRGGIRRRLHVRSSGRQGSGSFRALGRRIERCSFDFCAEQEKRASSLC